MSGDEVGVSRFLAYVLRHHPDAVGIELDGAGWVEVGTLLDALARHGRPVPPDLLDRVVAGTDKRRFEVRDGRIRAAQGHSVPVDLGLAPTRPPAVLYHGTVERFLPRILAGGLTPQRRGHVHLSADPQTATAVGARRGEPVVLTVDAAGMHGAGLVFFVADNGVWLTAHVPPRWIGRPAGP
jgi:putative RNA 2'-phosphotransferase